MRLSELFRQNVAGDPSLDPERLQQTLERLVAAAEKAWPALSLTAEDFVPYLAQRVPEATIEALEQMHVPDLWLACACTRGDANAIEAFTKSYLSPIFPLPGDLKSLSGDVEQMASVKLLVAEEGQVPRIADYSARGDLGSWLSVVTLRIALMLLRRKKREIPLGDEAALSRLAGSADPEVLHLKERYRAEFAQAFQDALGTLQPRERNVLRQHYIDRLPMEQVARVYRVHRITVVRWVERAREKLARETRKSLVARLGLKGGELESIMRLIRSQVDVSLRTYLGRDPGP